MKELKDKHEVRALDLKASFLYIGDSDRSTAVFDVDTHTVVQCNSRLTTQAVPQQARKKGYGAVLSVGFRKVISLGTGVGGAASTLAGSRVAPHR